MPQFEPSARNRSTDAFLRGYLDAAEFAGLYDDAEREALRDSSATAYPKGAHCPTCSPGWLASFLLHMLNVQRVAAGLDPLETV